MTAIALWIILPFTAIAFQSTLFHGAKPDLLLLVVYFFALQHNVVRSIVFGAFSGLLLDVSSGFIIGPGIISKALTGYFIVTLRQGVFGWGFLKNTLIILVATVMDYFVFLVSLETFSQTLSSSRTGISFILDAVYTILCSFILFPAVKEVFIDSA